MPERGNQPDLLKEYLDRLRVREKSPTVEEYSKRLTHLSAVRTLLRSLAPRGFLVSEGPSLLSSAAEGPLPGALGSPDYIVIREDVLVYVYLDLSGTKRLSPELARGIWGYLRDNPGLSAVVLVWPDEKYSSLAIDSFAIRNYLERDEPIDLSHEEAFHLVEAIERFYDAQFVDWKLSSVPIEFGREARVFRLTDQLHASILASFESEKARDLEIPEKIEAQGLISSDDIERILGKILALASQEKVSPGVFQELHDIIEALTKD